MVVTDRALGGGADGLAAAVGAAVSGGADAVQLREKDPDGRSLPASELSTLARRLREVTRGALLVVNGPLAVAVAGRAGGGPAGLALVEELARAVRVPVLAIGGVTAGRVEEVVRAGASGVAVISAVLAQPAEGGAAAEALRRALDAARG